MTITPDDVRIVAKLARLNFNEEEVARLARDLGDILQHASKIAELDLTDVEPTAHPIKLKNVWRPDEVRPSLTPEQALANAPAAEENKFRVPRILEVEDSEE